MTKPRKRNALPKPPVEASYEVGYKKPPVGSQWQPGQSPNPNGRPKGSKNKPVEPTAIHDIVLEEGVRTIKIPDGERTAKVSIARAIIRRIMIEAFKGNYRQQRLWSELQEKADNHVRATNKELFEIWINLKLKLEDQIEHNKKLGLPPPDMVIHPDQIHVDFHGNTIELTGPLTRKDKRALEAEIEQDVREITEPVLEEIAELEKELAETSDENERAEIQAIIAQRTGVVGMMEDAGKRKLQFFITGERPPEWDEK